MDVIRNRASDENRARNISHESDAVSCLEHVIEALTGNVLQIPKERLRTMCMSLSTDKETVYAGTESGVAVRWRDRLGNHAFIHQVDRAHKVEKLFEDVLEQSDMRWAVEFIEGIDSILDTDQSTKSMRVARSIDESFRTLKRHIKTRFIQYSVQSMESVINQYATLVMTIENILAANSDLDPVRLNQLKVLGDFNLIPTGLVLIHTFGLGVRISKASQGDAYTLWDDADAIEKFKDKLLQLVSEPESNPLLCQH